jgi:hypothetical protein
MNEPQVEWSSLSKKERKRLVKEQKRDNLQSNKKRGGVVKWVIIVIILAVFAWGVMWFIKEASKPIPGKELPNQGRDHVAEREWGKFKYNSNPPTSGPHDLVWTKKGVYDKPQGDGHLIHSLEHGYVIISYNCQLGKLEVGSQKLEVGTQSAQTDKDCLGFVNKVKVRVEKDSWKLILVPRLNLDTNFALTAWTRIEKFKTEEASMERVNNFIDSLRNHGPEQTME